jgi:hypothetical protein
MVELSSWEKWEIGFTEEKSPLRVRSCWSLRVRGEREAEGLARLREHLELARPSCLAYFLAVPRSSGISEG